MKKENSPKLGKSKKLEVLVAGLSAANHMLPSIKNPNQSESVSAIFQEGQNDYQIELQHYFSLCTLYSHIGLSEIIEEFSSKIITLPEEILGKRSSKIVMSKSRKFCLKYIEEADLNKINSMFSDFVAHNTEPQSCLADIFLIVVIEYSLKGIKIHDRYIIMPNARSQFESVIKGFDLKGHLDARHIDDEDCEDFKFGKDENFVKSQELQFIRENSTLEQRHYMLKAIKYSVQFMRKQQIIDYSLLISLEKFDKKTKQTSETQKNATKIGDCKYIVFCKAENQYILKWALIDYFQEYNEKKKMENKFKSLFRKSVSSVQPQVYAQRIVDFLHKYLL